MIVECVPNFSEGRDPAIISALEDAVRSVDHVVLLDRTSDPDHNRSVLTFAGSPGAIAEAAFRVVRVAVDKIDLTLHQGVHPRIGSADVVPFVPVGGITMEQCSAIARDFGARLWNELALPVYLYEASALRPRCERLEQIRSASFDLPPDFGTGRHPRAGATVTGARKFLIAWNINLESDDLTAAKSIAKAIRASSGGLPCVKALGLPLSSRGLAQVSMNLTDFERTPMHVAFERVRQEAKARGIAIHGSELIGLIPRAALEQSPGFDFRWEHWRDDMVLEQRLAQLKMK